MWEEGWSICIVWHCKALFIETFQSSNILLGDDMREKVADFGLGKNAPDGKGGKFSIKKKVVGTFSYLAPEYAVDHKVRFGVAVATILIYSMIPLYPTPKCKGFGMACNMGLPHPCFVSFGFAMVSTRRSVLDNASSSSSSAWTNPDERHEIYVSDEHLLYSNGSTSYSGFQIGSSWQSGCSITFPIPVDNKTTTTILQDRRGTNGLELQENKQILSRAALKAVQQTKDERDVEVSNIHAELEDLEFTRLKMKMLIQSLTHGAWRNEHNPDMCKRTCRGRKFGIKEEKDQNLIRCLLVITQRNQLDELDSRGDVKVILATKKIESLDPTLLRPSRIDRKIEFPLPNIKTRRRIFHVPFQLSTIHGWVMLQNGFRLPGAIFSRLGLTWTKLAARVLLKSSKPSFHKHINSAPLVAAVVSRQFSVVCVSVQKTTPAPLQISQQEASALEVTSKIKDLHVGINEGATRLKTRLLKSSNICLLINLLLSITKYPPCIIDRCNL
ncbi:hypothetical protein CTI12_AA589340 [Artemisia annua]|uniref:ATPase AAA-type core domain-containing protein n=1 Tax=Artemisia annua TaxID=35608 RepID=A0A2U1KL94_ARTAN|nr:hypothetical protein CTI12_AA589340 [Artemisia annua]